jgi:predicted unusual protein kinase regulating ubiquinone biosynthesis (AarF/ABC1/UbiB family)
MGEEDQKLSTGRFARLARLASMSARLSTEVVTRGVRRFGGGDPDPSLLGAGAAEKLVATLGDLKGLAMKLGQQVSMDPDLLSPEVRAVVARLQNQAPPMPWAAARKVLADELGRPPEEA